VDELAERSTRGIRAEIREADDVRAAVTKEAPFSGSTFRAPVLRLRSRGTRGGAVSVRRVRAAVKNGELPETAARTRAAVLVTGLDAADRDISGLCRGREAVSADR